MKKSVKYSLIGFIAFDLLAAALIFGYLFFAKNYWEAANSSKAELLIAKGSSFAQIVTQLENAGVIENPTLFKVFAYVKQHHGKYLAGYYQFDAGLSPSQVSQKLIDGDVAIFAITLPEGLLSEQIAATIQADKYLSGEITEIPSEGSLLPETYHFNYGEERQNIIKNMQASMAKALAQEWENRGDNLPYETKEEALIMASIIEKETGVAPERERIAAVFVNRLRRKMRLQSDPTANYGIYKETGELKTQLTGEDVAHYSVYNTYVIDGLPATPICNFGLASLKAALHPIQSDELYFVANGEGGHNFARNLGEHNRNVVKYRQKMKEANE